MTRGFLALAALALLAAPAIAQDAPHLALAREFARAFRTRDEAKQTILAARPAKTVQYTLAVYALLQGGQEDVAAALAQARRDAGGPEGEGLLRLTKSVRPTPRQLASVQAGEKLVAAGRAADALAALRDAGDALDGTLLGARILWVRAQAARHQGDRGDAARLYGRCAQYARSVGWLAKAQEAEGARLAVAPEDGEEALRAVTGLKEIAQQIDDRPALVKALALRAALHVRRGQRTEGREDYVGAIELAKQLDDRLLTAQLLGKLALVWQIHEGQPQRAYKFHKESLEILRELEAGGNEKVRATLRITLLNASIALRQQGRYADALALLDELVTEADALSRELRRMALAERANVFRHLGRLEKSLVAYREALAAAPEGDARTRLLVEVGNLHLQRGDLDAAQLHFDSVLEIEPKTNLDAYVGRATVRGLKGDVGAARMGFGDALELARTAPDKARVLRQRAKLERSWGDLQAALRSVRQSLDLLLKGYESGDPAERDYVNIGVSHLQIADLLLLDGQPEQALESLEKGAIFFFRLKQPWHAIPAYARWALVLTGLQRADAAVERITVLRKLAEGVPDDGLKSLAKRVEGWFEARAGRSDQAKRLLEEARALAAQGNEPVAEATALVHLALLTGDAALARNALDLLDARRTEGYEARPLVEGEHPGFAASIGVRALLSRAPERVAEAFALMERARTDRLQAALGGRDKILDATLPQPLLQAYLSAAGRLREARSENAPLGEAEAAFDAVVKRIRDEAPAEAALAFPRAPALEEVQRSLRPGEAFLVMLDDPYVRAHVEVTPTGASLRAHDAQAPLAAVAGAPNGARRLIVAPDGLQAIDETAAWGDKTVFDAFDIAYVPSAGAFVRLRAAGAAKGEGVARTANGPPRIANVIGNPPENQLALLHLGRPVRFDLTHPEASTHDLRTSWRADTIVLPQSENIRGPRPRAVGVTSVAAAFFRGGAREVVLSLPGPAPADLLDRFYANCLDRKMSPALALREAKTWARKRQPPDKPPFWAGMVLYGAP